MSGKVLNKVVNGTVWAYGLLGLMTFSYFVFLLVSALGVDSIDKLYFAPGEGRLPGPTYLFTTLDATWVWSTLAVASLIGNMAWGFWRARRTDLPQPHHLPMICHLIWIVTCTYFHLVGLWLPIFKMGETVG